MARVNLDSEMFGDTRFVFLAQLLGMADADTARMKCARVWHECTLRGRPALTPAAVDIAAGIPGFSSLLVEAELARVQKGLIYVRGTRGRIEWFQDKKRAGKAGGEATRKAWREKKTRDAQQLTEGQVPSSRKIASDRPSGSASASVSGRSGREEPGFALTSPEPAGPTPGSQLRAAFEPWYQERYGSEYDWSAKEGKHAKALAAKGPIAEILRRASIAAAQEWRRAPVTLGAILEGWNGLSVEVVPQKLTPQERADLERARRVNGDAR